MQLTTVAQRGAGADSGVMVAAYEDYSSQCSFVVATPDQQPALWSAYLRGARRSYRQHGVESVLEFDRVVDGTGTALFFAALDRCGSVVGGMRAQGAYHHVDQAHAVAEWAGRSGTEELRQEIGARIDEGVIELKSGWVEDTVARRSELTDALARVFVHSLRLMGVRYAIGTAAQHAVRRWQSTGGVVCDAVEPVPYPSDRYRTVLMTWDSVGFAELSSPRQLPHLLSEAAQLTGGNPRRGFAGTLA